MNFINSFLLLWIFILFCGCPQDNNNPSTQVNPFAEVSLNVAVPQGVMSLDDWKTLSREWETRTKVSVKFMELPQPYPHDQLTGTTYIKQITELNPQLMIFPWELKGLLGKEHLLSPFPPSAVTENELDWSNYFKGFRKNVCQIEEQPGLIPLALPTYKLFYRKDLLEQAQKNIPQSWDELIVFGKELPQWGEGKGILLPLAESTRMEMLLSIMLPYVTTNESLSLCYDFSSGNSTCEHPGFTRGFTRVEEINRIIAKESMGLSPQNCLQKLLAGEAMMVIADESCLPLISANTSAETLARNPAVKLGIVPLPGAREQYDFFKKEWVSLPDTIVHRVTMVGSRGYVAGITTLLPENDELKQTTKLAACNLLSELIKTGMVDSAGKTILTPTRVADLTSNVATLPEEFSFPEQTDILETIQAQLQDKLCFSPALLPQDGFEEFWQSIANKAFTGETADALTKELVLKNAELVLGLTPSKVREYYRAQLGLKQIPNEATRYVPDLPTPAATSKAN
jgi:hypothetical protein